jgi:hypothetical protein
MFGSSSAPARAANGFSLGVIISGVGRSEDMTRKIGAV